MVVRRLDESGLIACARDSDTHAFAELVRAYQAIALRTAFVISRNRNDAEEAVQEAFTEAYWALGRFRLGAAFKPWLLRIVVNEAHNCRRSSEHSTVLAHRDDGDLHGEDSISPEAAPLERERREALLAGLTPLRPRDRDALAFRYRLSLTDTEPAAVLGLRTRTVKSRLSRALARLRVEIGGRR